MEYSDQPDRCSYQEPDNREKTSYNNVLDCFTVAYLSKYPCNHASDEGCDTQIGYYDSDIVDTSESLRRPVPYIFYLIKKYHR
jgi:hypothetical protein